MGMSSFVELVSSLMWGGKTVSELQDAVGLSADSVENFIAEASQSGIIYRRLDERARIRKQGHAPYRYFLQSKPFEVPYHAE